jgi:hypothetical protein
MVGLSGLTRERKPRREKFGRKDFGRGSSETPPLALLWKKQPGGTHKETHKRPTSGLRHQGAHQAESVP